MDETVFGSYPWTKSAYTPPGHAFLPPGQRLLRVQTTPLAVMRPKLGPTTTFNPLDTQLGQSTVVHPLGNVIHRAGYGLKIREWPNTNVHAGKDKMTVGWHHFKLHVVASQYIYTSCILGSQGCGCRCLLSLLSSVWLLNVRRRTRTLRGMPGLHTCCCAWPSSARGYRGGSPAPAPSTTAAWSRSGRKARRWAQSTICHFCRHIQGPLGLNYVHSAHAEILPKTPRFVQLLAYIYRRIPI